MPANLPPQYFETEKKLKTAKTPHEKIKILEELLAIVPKHKGTEKLRALLKTKIAKLKSHSQEKPVVAKHGPSFHVEKSGAGQVIVIGPPNSGKSSLIAALTGAQPDIGDYPFTTRFPSPYMMRFENVQVQLVDTPPLIPDFIEAGLLELIKAADGVLFVLDLSDLDAPSILESLLLKLEEKRIHLYSPPAHSFFDSQLFCKKTLVVTNKNDLPSFQENLPLLQEFFSSQFNFALVSALQGEGLEELPNQIFKLIGVIRVYSKTPRKKADLEDPFCLKKGSTVLDMARAVHKDFVEKFKYARIWRENVYQGQMVNRDHPLEDEDIIELHI